MVRHSSISENAKAEWNEHRKKKEEEQACAKLSLNTPLTQRNMLGIMGYAWPQDVLLPHWWELLGWVWEDLVSSELGSTLAMFTSYMMKPSTYSEFYFIFFPSQTFMTSS